MQKFHNKKGRKGKYFKWFKGFANMQTWMDTNFSFPTDMISFTKPFAIP